MATKLEEFRKNFLMSNESIADISHPQFSDIPSEISLNDVYNYSLIFKNEDIAIDYCCKKYMVNRDKIVAELHEEDTLREEFGKDNFLRTAQIKNTLYISELNDGTYILWEAY